MRNSFLPIILLVLTVAGSLWLIRGGAARGAGGPAVFPGILKLPNKAKLMTGSAELTATNKLLGDIPAGSAGWRVWLLSTSENQPLTNAVLLALGEELTKRGCIAIMEPTGKTSSEPLPLGADVQVRIATTATQLPAGAPGELSFVTTFTTQPVRVPPDHPAARWFPDLPAASPSAIQLTHHSTVSKPSAWPEWYAALGRSVSEALLSYLSVPAAATDTTEILRATAWVMPGESESASIFGRIPSPPQGDVVEHLVAFQHPFVRGWIGKISPVPVTSHEGGTRPAGEEIIRRLVRGGWTAGPTEGTRLTFNKDDAATDDTVIHRSLTIDGEQVIEWQERPHPIALWQAWKDAAHAGDAAAAAQLARHQTTAGIAADLR